MEQIENSRAAEALASMTTNRPMAPGVSGGSPRARPWKEKTSDERTDLLREEVRELRRTQNVLIDLVNKLCLHHHDASAGLVIPMQNAYGSVNAMPQRFHDPLA